MPKLENWSVGVYTSNPYEAPELGRRCLSGDIFGDDRFEDGSHIRTSELQFLCTKTGRATTKSGTDYILGDPDGEWVSWLEQEGYDLALYDLEPIPKI
jgi:hypothetical protein